MSGVQLLKPGLDKPMIYAEKNCLDCTKEQMDKIFEVWKTTMKNYYRKMYKGVKISPWHHYKAKNLDNELK